jgi:hypothetical protein
VPTRSFVPRAFVTGDRPPLNPVSCWRVERQGSVVYIREKREVAPIAPSPATPGASRSIIILEGIVRLADSAGRVYAFGDRHFR